MADYQISPLKKELAALIVSWHYPEPYQVYDLSRDDLSGLLNPDYRYHQVLDQAGNLIGYCCFGVDAQVPGGDYREEEPDFLDVGVGMHPDLVGRGLGRDFVSEILAFARDTYRPDKFRVTVADFNQRSLRTFKGLGFKESGYFNRKPGGMPFTQLERRANE